MKKGFLTPNAGRPDVYRAANFILRLANDGFKVLLYYRPPGYEEEKRDEKGHEVKVKTAMVQARDSS